MIFKLTAIPSVGSSILVALRDKNIQNDRFRFRENLKRLGFILAYELSKSLDYERKTIETPLEQMEVEDVKEPPIVLAILRAALPMYDGVLSVFSESKSGFIGAYRVEGEEDTVEIDMDYIAHPSLEGKEVILVDPMLATGKSLIKAIEGLLKKGMPKKIHVVSAIASQQGIEFLQTHYPDVDIWVGDIDPVLNEKAYIVPGLGDAGDLCYGEKI